MRKFVIVFFFVLSVLHTKAAHLGGYTLSIVNIKDANNLPTDNYMFVLRSYYNYNFSYPSTLNFKLYSNSSSTLIQNVVLSTVSVTPHNFPAENCLPADSSGAFRTILYNSAAINLSAFNDTTGYYLSLSSGCCFTGNVNYTSNGSMDYIMRLDFPAVGNLSPYRYNSSPEFRVPPRSSLCLGIPTVQRWAAVDPDGDKIIYSFGQMESSNEIKPFTYTNFSSSSYSINNPIVGRVNSTLDPDSAFLSMYPIQAGGHYLVVKAEEYRNNKKIGEIVRLVYVNIALNCPSTQDLDPVIRFNESKALSIKRDTIDVNTIRSYNFFVSDSGALNDSIHISMDLLNSWNVLDTNSYKWELLDVNNNPISVFRNNLNITALKSAKLRFTLDPTNSSLIDSPIKFKLEVKDNSCYSGRIDTFIYEVILTRKDSILNTISNITSSLNKDVSLKILMSNNFGFTYKWQTDFGNGFRDLPSNAKYVNVNTDSLVIKNLLARNDNQLFRCIATGLYNVDTSINFRLSLVDTCYQIQYDTTKIQVQDTSYKIVYNNVLISKNDTINFEFTNSNPGANNKTRMSINHTDDAKKLEFNLSSLQGIAGFKIEIEDLNGQKFYLKSITSTYISTTVDNFISKGLYKFIIRDASNNIVMVKNLILI